MQSDRVAARPRIARLRGEERATTPCGVRARRKHARDEAKLAYAAVELVGEPESNAG